MPAWNISPAAKILENSCVQLKCMREIDSRKRHCENEATQHDSTVAKAAGARNAQNRGTRKVLIFESVTFSSGRLEFMKKAYKTNTFSLTVRSD